MERPNTVAGLLAKRKELAALRSRLEMNLKRIVCDLDHLDATILLFGADATPAEPGAGCRTGPPTGHQGQGPTVRAGLPQRGRRPRHVQGDHRGLDGGAGLRTDDGTFVVLRKRVGACLIGLREAGVVRNGEGRGRFVGYELAPKWGAVGEESRNDLACN
jgi:hypothetical protein